MSFQKLIASWKRKYQRESAALYCMKCHISAGAGLSEFYLRSECIDSELHLEKQPEPREQE